jgi:methyl-accepting chemotaxis protein
VGEVATSIAVALEQQGAATRDIAERVQAVSHRNEAASAAVRNVSAVAEDADAASRDVLAAAGEVARVAAALREEVDGFLASMQAEEAPAPRLPAAA